MTYKGKQSHKYGVDFAQAVVDKQSGIVVRVDVVPLDQVDERASRCPAVHGLELVDLAVREGTTSQFTYVEMFPKLIKVPTRIVFDAQIEMIRHEHGVLAGQVVQVALGQTRT